GGSVGIGFSIPSNMVRQISGQLIEFGTLRRGWLGVNVQAIDDAIAEEKKTGTGVGTIQSWARSKDGSLILSAAGIETCERTIDNLAAFVRRGIKTTVA
ncbi:MAG: DUF6280 family protein, partial [Pseudomonadota bacterium]